MVACPDFPCRKAATVVECRLTSPDYEGRPTAVLLRRDGRDDTISIADYIQRRSREPDLPALREMVAAHLAENPGYASLVKMRARPGRASPFVQICDGLNVLEELTLTEFNKRRENGDAFSAGLTYQTIRDNAYGEAGDRRNRRGGHEGVFGGLTLLQKRLVTAASLAAVALGAYLCLPYIRQTLNEPRIESRNAVTD